MADGRAWRRARRGAYWLQVTPTALNAAVTAATERPRSLAAVRTPQAPLLKLVLGVQ
jgi:hypothetical protein